MAEETKVQTNIYDPESPEAQEAEAEGIERNKANEEYKRKIFAEAEKKEKRLAENRRRQEAYGEGLAAIGLPERMAPSTTDTGKADSGGEGGSEPKKSLYRAAGGLLPDPDSEFIGEVPGLDGGPERVGAVQVKLTAEGEIAGTENEIRLMGLIVRRNAIMTALAAGKTDLALSLSRDMAGNIVGPKPGVRDDALKQKRAQGPMQMDLPDFPDDDKQLIAKLSLAGIGSVLKNLAAAGRGGQASAVGGMVVDPGSKILSETGKMLAADVNKYDTKAERVHEMNFLLRKEYQDDLIKMQDALDQRLDINDRAYMAQISAATQNAFSHYDNLVTSLTLKEGALGTQKGKASDDVRNKEEIINKGYLQQKMNTNAQLQQSWKIATAAHNLNRFRVEQEAKRRGGDAGPLLNGARSGATLLSVSSAIKGQDPKLLGKFSVATTSMLEDGVSAERNAANRGRQFLAIAHNNAREQTEAFLSQTQNLSPADRAKVAMALKAAGKYFGPNIMDSKMYGDFVARVVAAKLEDASGQLTGKAMEATFVEEVFAPYVEPLSARGWVRNEGGFTRPVDASNLSVEDQFDIDVANHATPLSFLYVLDSWGKEEAAQIERTPGGAYNPAEHSAAREVVESEKIK